MTATPQTAPLLAETGGPFAGELARNPLGRVGRPEDVAHAVLFLASDEAAHVQRGQHPGGRGCGGGWVRG